MFLYVCNMLQKNLYRITFLNFYKNVYDRSALNENILTRNAVTRNSTKMTFIGQIINVFIVIITRIQSWKK